MENSRLERWWEESCKRAELQEDRAIDEQDGWKKVGRNGKVVEGKSVGRNAKIIGALEEQATESTAVEKDSALGSTRKANAEKDEIANNTRNQSLDSASTSGLDGKDAAQSVSSTGNIVAVAEESLLTYPSTPISSLEEEQEATAALKASLAESNDGWQVVGPRRRGHRN